MPTAIPSNNSRPPIPLILTTLTEALTIILTLTQAKQSQLRSARSACITAIAYLSTGPDATTTSITESIPPNNTHRSLPLYEQILARLTHISERMDPLLASLAQTSQELVLHRDRWEIVSGSPPGGEEGDAMRRGLALSLEKLIWLEDQVLQIDRERALVMRGLRW